jgi:cytochrome c553
MKQLHFALAIAATAAALAAGCANPERSRDVANPSVSAKVLAQQVCSNCHGVTGVSISPNFPNLAAQMPAYLAAQLKVFRNHDRSDPAGFEYMWGLSRSLTDEQIQGLADYYAHQAPPHGVAVAHVERATLGDKLFHEGIPGKNVPACMVCHGDKGQGNEQFPRLAGQHEDYVTKQLMVFQRGNERPEGAIMKTIAHELTHEDVLNAAAYVQSIGTPSQR